MVSSTVLFGGGSTAGGSVCMSPCLLGSLSCFLLCLARGVGLGDVYPVLPQLLLLLAHAFLSCYPQLWPSDVLN